eukprot:TRINITY_DN3886_c0_g1_i1.p1 TRINITY_DN3886_c0_g1~~TRINITY_DN3886_c0_g1_i1.p1  ORF type:complete len:669 (+),score=243.55 TRINITY_DN3886_c0_g1_i1:3-2009(+)
MLRHAAAVLVLCLRGASAQTTATAATTAATAAATTSTTAAAASTAPEKWVDNGTPNYTALILGCIYVGVSLLFLGWVLARLFAERKWHTQMVRSELAESRVGAGKIGSGPLLPFINNSAHAHKFWGSPHDDDAPYHAASPVRPLKKKARRTDGVHPGAPALVILTKSARKGGASMAAAAAVAQRLGAGAVKCLCEESGEPATRAAVLGGLRWLSAAAKRDAPVLLVVAAEPWGGQEGGNMPAPHAAVAPEDAPPPHLSATGFKPADFFEAGPVRASEILAELQHGLSHSSAVGVVYDVPSPHAVWTFPHLMTPLDCTPPPPAARSTYPPQPVVALAMHDDDVHAAPGRLLSGLYHCGAAAGACVEVMHALEGGGLVAGDGGAFPVFWSNRFLDDTDGCVFPPGGGAAAAASGRALGYSPPRPWSIAPPAPPSHPPMRPAASAARPHHSTTGRPAPVWFQNLQQASVAPISPRSPSSDGRGSPWLRHPPTFGAAAAPVWGAAPPAAGGVFSPHTPAPASPRGMQMQPSAGSPRRSVSPGAVGLSEQLYHSGGPPEKTNCLLRSPAPAPTYTYRKAALRAKMNHAWVLEFSIEGEPRPYEVAVDAVDRCGVEPAGSTDYPNQTLFLAPYDQPRLVVVVDTVRQRDAWIAWLHAMKPGCVVILPSTFSLQP